MQKFAFYIACIFWMAFFGGCVFCDIVTTTAKNASKNYTVMHTNCPKMCQCYDNSHVECERLNASQIDSLFLPDGNFVVNFANSLQNFTLRHSQIADLTAISAAAKFTKLLFLDLSWNEIESLHTTVIDVYLPTVVTLNIAHNKIPSITRDAFLLFPNVEEIRADFNGIFSIDWEAFRLFQLKRLFLSHNHLATINEHMLRLTPNLELLDLSHNQLTLAQSSSFFAAQRLARIDLSFNRIQRFRYDSFAPLFQLESFDLAFNNLSAIPADLRQFIGLRALNLSGNPFERICAGELDQPVLQVLDASNCPRLRLVEAGAFAKLPNLQTAILSNNSALSFISPKAFHATNLLFELDLSGCALKSLDDTIVGLPTRFHLARNPLKCECIAATVFRHLKHIVDADIVTCTAIGSGSKRRVLDWSTADTSGASCVGGAPLLPFGTEVSAKIGEFFSLYCMPLNSSDIVLWTLPNGTQIVANQTEEKDFFGPSFVAVSTVRDDTRPFLTSASLHFPHVQTASTQRLLTTRSQSQSQQQPQQRQRIVVTREQMRFEVLTAGDEGEYRCRTLRHDATFDALNAADRTEEKVVRLRVARPLIGMSAVEMGSHYASLAWNDSLRIRATDKVALSLDVRDGESGQLSRSIQLSLHNPWYSYNVMRLKPLNNYTFCLAYRMLSYDLNLNPVDAHSGAHTPGFAAMFVSSSAQNTARQLRESAPIFEACVNAQTLENLSFLRSLDATTVITMAAVAFFLVALLTVRAIYLRFYIWQETKLRARMNESLSGQSFLSNSSSVQNAFGGISNSVTFENTPQILNQETNLSRFPRGGEQRATTTKKMATHGAPAKRSQNGAATLNEANESSRMLKFDDIAV